MDSVDGGSLSSFPPPASSSAPPSYIESGCAGAEGLPPITGGNSLKTRDSLPWRPRWSFPSVIPNDSH